MEMFSWSVILLVTGFVFIDAETDTFNTTVCSSGFCTYDRDNDFFDCSHSGCTELPQEIPKESKYVNLSGNSLTTLDGTLQDFPEILELSLSDNNIGSIAKNAFPPNLVSLNLSNNAIDQDLLSDYLFKNLIKLEYLNLANNKVSNLTVPGIFSQYQDKLKTLDLSGNRIESIRHNVVTDLYRLTNLDLSRNQVRYIDANDFLGLNDLLLFNMSKNSIESIPDLFFDGMFTVETVDFSDNKIAAIGETAFYRCGFMKTLILKRNRLQEIKALAFHPLRGLNSLNLDENPLENIEPRSLPQTLTSLSIQKCDSLTEIGDVFEDQPSLKTIQIKQNKVLSAISEDAFGLTPIKVAELDLSYNALKSLPPNLVDWGNITSVNLAGNLWECDCNMAWIKQLPASNPIFQSFVCHSPLHLRGVNASALDASQFSCSTVSRYRAEAAIAFGLFFTVFVIITIVIVTCKYRHNICPSLYPIGKYETLYSSSEAAADDEFSQPVTIKKKYTEAEEPVAV